MKAFLTKTLSLLGQTWAWSLALVLGVAALVWWIGPMLAINDLRPWAEVAARLTTLSVLFLLWGLSMVFTGWRANRQQQDRDKNPDNHAQAEHDQRLDAESKSLHTRFNEALRTLATSGLYRDQPQRVREELPWYLLIGPPGSGKTSLLECSGVEFPLNRPDRVSPGTHRPTELCDWYFAEQGVLLDTAGRYLNPPDAAPDGHAWTTLLGLLRKRRRTLPLNGVLVSIPVPLLLEGKDVERLALAEHLRSRLQELNRVLHVQVPVYLILSQADHLPGFDAFFDALSLEQNRQVLGASFSREKPASEPGVVRQEFDALLRHLDSQLIGRLHQERDTARRSLILDFPHQLGMSGERLCQMIDTVFDQHLYQRSPLLRGFYLTSVPHPEHPRVNAQAQSPEQARTTPDFNARTRFIHDLFSKVIFPEAGLVDLDPRERRRIHWGQRTLLVGGLATLVLGGVLWTSGFSANHERLETLRTLAGNWQQQHKTLHPGDDAMTLLKVLEISAQASQVFPAAGKVAWHERSGLYQGTLSQPVLREVYERELLTHLLPDVAQLLEARIAASLHDRQALLGNLRAYLMLNLQARRDSVWLENWLGAEWSRLYPGHDQVQNDLNRHFEQLLSLSFSQPLNDTLVTRARQTLRSESLASVVYRTLREEARSLPDYRLSQHLGPQRELFVGADQAIPGLYTRQGYRQFFSVQGTARVNELLRDNWVLGEGSEISGRDLRQLLVELEQLYFRDYATHWSEAVGRLGLMPFSDAGEGADLAAGLLSSSSPVVQLLLQIRENTRFPLPLDAVETALEPTADKAAVPGKAATALASKASTAIALPDNARRAMQLRFEPLHRLLDEKDMPSADLAVALQGLEDVQQQLASLARASQPEQFAFDMAKARMSGQRDALSQLRNSAARLPRPVSGWFNVMAEDAWRLVLGNAYQHLNQRYQSELHGFYAKAIAQRYPFNAHSTSDVALNDFREFFKSQGVLESFFEQHLKAFVSGHPGSYRLRSIDGHSLPMSRVLLDQMSAAQVIRQGFFAEDPSQPQVRFKLEPYSLDSAVNRAEFRLGERLLEYRHGPIVPMTFTWPDETGQGGASLVAERLVGRPVGIEKNLGPWSLFRLLDLMQIEPLSGRDVLLLKADLGGLRANYLLTSQRMPNPFDVSALRSFRLPAQL
ncbi:type VI secretion system membrane subunit TssM [Pseudomonas sp. 3A(2025)]